MLFAVYNVVTISKKVHVCFAKEMSCQKVTVKLKVLHLLSY